MAEKKEKSKMTVKEAGHKGGEKTAETHGKEFYEEIGHKGRAQGRPGNPRTHKKGESEEKK